MAENPKKMMRNFKVAEPGGRQRNLRRERISNSELRGTLHLNTQRFRSTAQLTEQSDLLNIFCLGGQTATVDWSGCAKEVKRETKVRENPVWCWML